jgi:hypothetical protein
VKNREEGKLNADQIETGDGGEGRLAGGKLDLFHDGVFFNSFVITLSKVRCPASLAQDRKQGAVAHGMFPKPLHIFL